MYKQTPYIHLWILPYKCFVIQKYSVSFTDFPYKVGTCMACRMKWRRLLTTYMWWSWVMHVDIQLCKERERGWGEGEGDIVLEETEKQLKSGRERKSQLEGEHTRDVRTPWCQQSWWHFANHYTMNEEDVSMCNTFILFVICLFYIIKNQFSCEHCVGLSGIV